MKDRRKEKRLKDDNEINITIVDNEKKPIKGKRLNGRTMDISGSGAKIKTHTLLPVYTLIVIKIKLKKLKKTITTTGIVKWTIRTLKDKFFIEGIEFVNSPSQEILQLKDYISRGVDIHSTNDK